MNIVVCIKQVPNTKQVRIDPSTNNIIREGIPNIMNPYDANAVEEALRIREQNGGKVTVLSMGPKQAERIIQEALDMGADRGILLCDKAFAGADTLATSYTLATVIKELKADLVLCGQEAIDGATGQVGPMIAENLGWIQFTCVSKIKIEKNAANISREVRNGIELYNCELPLVVCVLKEINTPRKPDDPNNKKTPEIMTVQDFSFDQKKIGFNGSPTRVVSITTIGKENGGFVKVNGSLPAEERIRILMNGGISPKKINFIRGDSKNLANIIMQDDLIKRHIGNLKEIE